MEIKPVIVTTGEEELAVKVNKKERKLFERGAQFKFYNSTTKNWVKVGHGKFQILKDLATSETRVVMRSKETQTVFREHMFTPNLFVKLTNHKTIELEFPRGEANSEISQVAFNKKERANECMKVIQDMQKAFIEMEPGVAQILPSNKRKLENEDGYPTYNSLKKVTVTESTTLQETNEKPRSLLTSNLGNFNFSAPATRTIVSSSDVSAKSKVSGLYTAGLPLLLLLNN